MHLHQYVVSAVCHMLVLNIQHLITFVCTNETRSFFHGLCIVSESPHKETNICNIFEIVYLQWEQTHNFVGKPVCFPETSLIGHTDTRKVACSSQTKLYSSLSYPKPPKYSTKTQRLGIIYLFCKLFRAKTISGTTTGVLNVDWRY